MSTYTFLRPDEIVVITTSCVNPADAERVLAWANDLRCSITMLELILLRCCEAIVSQTGEVAVRLIQNGQGDAERLVAGRGGS